MIGWIPIGWHFCSQNMVGTGFLKFGVLETCEGIFEEGTDNIYLPAMI